MHTNSFFLIFLLTFYSMQVNAAIDVRVDRNSIQLDESFRVIYTATDQVDGDPDFSVLERDFEILSNNKSNQTHIVNGSVDMKQQWSLTLIAKRSGTIRIPAVQFGQDKTKSFIITVSNSQAGTHQSAQAQSQDVFLETSLSPDSAYVQQQLIYRVRLYRSVVTSEASISEPEVLGIDALVQKLGEDQHYRKTINGRLYEIFQREYAIFPQQSGHLTVKPIIFKARLGRAGFFTDPFDYDSKVIVRRSKASELDIAAIPAHYNATEWLPANRITVQEKWSEQPEKFEVGKAITRTIELQAEGLTASQIPEMDMKLPDSIKAYPETPELEDTVTPRGINGTRRQSVALIPASSGILVLPEIRIPYWSIDKQAMAEAVLPEKTIQVSASSQAEYSGVNQGAMPQQEAQLSEQLLTNEQTMQSIHSVDTVSDLPWKISTFIFACAWIISILLLIRKKPMAQKTNKLQDEPRPQVKTLVKEIEQACLNNQAHIGMALILKWGKVIFPDSQLISLRDLDACLNNALENELLQLNESLYGVNHTVWDGKAFWNAFRKIAQEYPQKSNKQQQGLPTLFKLAT